MIGHKRVFGLDLMRVIAITLVIFGHLGYVVGSKYEVLSQIFAFLSFIGVEIFFVLSGFLIGRILFDIFRDDFSFQHVLRFLKRRWTRTLPNYFLILVVNLIIAFAIGYEIDQLPKYFVFLQNFASPMLPFFTESWSLSVEEFAYVILPLSLLAGVFMFRSSNKSQVFISVILGLVALFIGLKFIHHWQNPGITIDQWNLGVKSVVIFRIDSICIGVAFAWMSITFNDIWMKARFLMAVIGVIGIAFYFVGIAYFRLLIDDYPLFWNVFYLPILSAVIGFFLPVLSVWRSATSALSNPVTFLALISYSLYLVHYGIVLQVMTTFLDIKSLGASVFIILYLSLTICLSTILFKFYEKPIMQLRDR